jgi:protein-S-isoprenylcysteine O-methyltransferase Ste14
MSLLLVLLLLLLVAHCMHTKVTRHHRTQHNWLVAIGVTVVHCGGALLLCGVTQVLCVTVTAPHSTSDTAAGYCSVHDYVCRECMY